MMAMILDWIIHSNLVEPPYASVTVGTANAHFHWIGGLSIAFTIESREFRLAILDPFRGDFTCTETLLTRTNQHDDGSVSILA